MRVSNRLKRYALIVPLAWAAACGDDDTPASPPGTLPPDVEQLRTALAPFTSLTLAKQAGYEIPLTDCMSNGDVGAMGIHFAKPALVDGNLDPTQPEVLMYEPGTDGERSLVGVEFVVPFAAVPSDAAAPSLFGQTFSPDHVFQVWALHVWTHRLNPSGPFSPWNPRVRC
jgi:hypothetical protein